MIRSAALACCLGAGLATGLPCGGAGQASAAPAEVANPFLGTWRGTLDHEGGSYALVFRIARSASGELTGSLDSPDQGALDIPLSDIRTVAGAGPAGEDSIAVWSRPVQGRYLGVLSEDGRSIAGTWRQSGLALPLDLRREPDRAVLRPRRTGRLPGLRIDPGGRGARRGHRL